MSNPDTASNRVAIRIINDDPDNYGLWMGGASGLGIQMDSNPDNDCYENAASGVCALNDYAEMMEFSEMPNDGEVAVIDKENPGKLEVSAKPYDRLVAGIASENPAMVIGSYDITIKGWNRNQTSKDGSPVYPLAIAGRKLIKVSNENGEINPGDLLVSSSQRGKAMRCDDYAKCQGAIVGKAMTNSGDNEIVLALITLQ